MKALLQLALGGTLALTACSKSNPYYCEGAPDNNCANTDGGQMGCQKSADCTNASAPVCDTAAHVCVACGDGETQACMGNTPVCSNHECVACTSHGDCDSNVCVLDTGACAGDGEVAYVDPNATDNDVCTRTMPCTKVAKALATGRPYVKLQGMTNEQVTVAGKTVALFADPGAKLTSTTNGIILKVEGATQLTIHDLEISGASGAGNPGISLQPGNTANVSLYRVTVSGNQGGGITASGGALALYESTVSGNQGSGLSLSGVSLTMSRSLVSINRGGGISISGTSSFDITNNFIFRNGDPDASMFGGVNIGVATPGVNRFEFNTIADNRSSPGTIRAGGVLCDIPGFAGGNNIIARNAVGGSTTVTNAQTLGQCTYPTSKIQADVTDLAFVSADAAPYNYKLTAGSSAIDQATTSSSINSDYDLDVRPQGGQKDIGADEYK
ncbi:MAG: right-handed parallel beta-helix repeat-containing protein [Kofleriaceae bacterium]|nr:right-handed parallel beta-helix repeat-containing protein [Kofleriaceae bacterium]